ncbi:MAG: hypothetical protein FWE11_09275 [Defluviitaleaceae bacterium]|nr:hypothetical protein [Defluviitaleaceae bacterium]
MPKPFTFTFNGKNSREMGLYATSYDTLLPPKRQNREEIPHRHGGISHSKPYYSDRTLVLRCFWLNEKLKNLSREDIREIAYWLSQKGTITLDCEPDRHYSGEIFDPPELIAHYNRAKEDIRTTDGGFELIFLCDPFAFGPRKQKQSETGQFRDIDYQGTTEAPTQISIHNPNSFPVEIVRITHTRIRNQA